MKKIFLVSALVSLFTSCTTIGTISYDRLQAADVNYPEAVRRVGVVNNMLPSSLVVESSSDLLEGDGKIMAESFAEAVAATNYFDQVVLCESPLRDDSSQSGTMKGLSQAQADSLIQVLDVDFLFSLNRVAIQLKENSFYVPGLSTPVSVIDGIITPEVQAYAAGLKAPVFSISKSDSIYWDVNPSLDLKQVITESSEFAATIPLKHLLPYWEETTRYFYNGGDVNMRDAAVSIQEGDWDAAFELLEKVYQQKKGAAKMRAAYNMALYYEMNDSFEQAKACLAEAMQLAKEGSAEKNMMEVYRVQLNSLADAHSKLKVQMQRFENNF